MQELFDLIGRIRIDMTGFEQGMNEVESKVSAVSDNLNKVSQNFTNIGREANDKVTRPILAVGKTALDAAVSFESAFAGVRKTVDASEEQFAEFRKTILDMSTDLPATADEIAAVFEMGGQLGIAKDSLESFSRTIIDLGESTDLSLDQAATSFARFANITGMSQGDFDRLGSSVVALGNSMATTESEIVGMSMRLAAQGKQVGMSESEIMALSASMSSLGIQSEMGGTAMTTILKKINGAVEEGGKSLESFAEVAGMSSEEFGKLFKDDAIGGLDAIVKGLNRVSSEGGNVAETLADLGMKGIYESDVMMRLSGASDLLGEALKTSNAGWKENTALSEEAAERYKTTESQLKMLKNEVIALAIQFGEILIPILLSVVQFIKPIIQRFSEMSDGTKKFIVVIGLIAAAVGPVLIAIGSVIGAVSKIIGVFSSFAGILGKVVPFASKFGGLFLRIASIIPRLLTPIGLISLAITGLIAVFKMFGIDVVGGLVSGIKSGIKWAIDGIKLIGKAIIDAFKAMLGIASPSTVFIQFGKWIIEGLINGVSAMIGAIVDIFSSLGTAIINVVRAWMALVLQAFESAKDAIIRVVTAIWNVTVKIFTAMKDAVINVVNFLIRFVINLFTTMYRKTVDLFTAMRAASINVVTQMVTTLLNLFKRIIQGAIRMGSQIVSAVRSAFSKAWEATKGFVKKAYSLGADFVGGIAKGIADGVRKVTKAVGNVASKAVAKFKDALDIRSPSRVMRTLARYIPEGVGEGIVDGIDFVQGAISKVSRTVTNGANFVIDKIKLPSILNLANFLQTPRVVDLAPRGTTGGNSVNPDDGGTVNVHVRKLEDVSSKTIQNKVERNFFNKARQRE